LNIQERKSLGRLNTKLRNLNRFSRFFSLLLLSNIREKKVFKPLDYIITLFNLIDNQKGKGAIGEFPGEAPLGSSTAPFGCGSGTPKGKKWNGAIREHGTAPFGSLHFTPLLTSSLRQFANSEL